MAGGDEHLDGEDADMAEGLGDAGGDGERFVRQCRLDRGGHGRGGEDAGIVDVLGDVEGADGAVPAAGENDGVTRASRMAGASPIARQAETGSSPARMVAWPLPS
jgi:hypothetical protein